MTSLLAFGVSKISRDLAFRFLDCLETMRSLLSVRASLAGTYEEYSTTGPDFFAFFCERFAAETTIPMASFGLSSCVR